MGMLTAIRDMLALPSFDDVAVRTVAPAFEFPDMQTQIAMIRRGGTVPDALSVPSIYRAVTLIANTVGAMSLEAYRDGSKMTPADTPLVVRRPDPFTVPREFFRSTAYSMACYGEAFWWIAKRDSDGNAISLVPMPPQEVTVEERPRDPLRPRIEWRGEVMRNADVRHVIMSRDPGKARGSGPLQKCGIAISVATEAQQWAQNFFAGGGVPSILIKTVDEQTEDSAKALKGQWLESPPNVPRVIDPLIDSVTEFGVDPEKAQLSDTRRMVRGDAAVMFGIPGALLEYAEPGSSLTYQNISQVFDLFVRSCLWPNYLEPIEQSISDLLTRSTVARFNVAGLLRPDVKTRYEVHEKAINIGVYDAEYAQQLEGIAAGDIETAPVPFAPPQAVPASLPIEGRTALAVVSPEVEVRCTGTYARRGVMVRCGRKLGTAAPGGRLYCRRCKVETEAA